MVQRAVEQLEGEGMTSDRVGGSCWEWGDYGDLYRGVVLCWEIVWVRIFGLVKN